MTEQYFHFTLGPVQGFVAQARRTRDFWAGSFLLSWLSAVAMKAIEQQNGDILFPQVDKNYLDWLEGKGQGEAPQQGRIPNRFKGGIAKVPHDFDPKQVADSVQHAWESLAEEVWQQDFSNLNDDSITRQIWTQQIQHFWEISWAISASLEESDLLDRRKNWRSHLPPEESGVKCMMMDGWQELSGTSTPNAEGLGQFWNTLRQQGGTLTTDLREHEYLCAIAFIKRRFTHCFDQLKADMPSQWCLQGWRVSSSVPSVSYIAAAPWLAKILEHAPEQELKVFHDTAKELTCRYGEYGSQLQCITQALEKQKTNALLWKTQNLDGNVFFETALQNSNIYPDQEQAANVLQALKALRKSTKIEAVSPFYAVLMMDGDSLGKQMSDSTKQTPISLALQQFTQGVNTIVTQYSGFLIYAGGDDVMALLPLEEALNCAYRLREHYLDCFKKNKIESTLSGAIEYAHINIPLGKVLGDAHHLLDDIAKDKTGRDSIAVRVWKPGGQHLEWAMPWQKAMKDGQVSIQNLANDFQKDQQETPFSNSFFFHVEERFAMLNKNADADHFVFDQATMVQLIAADYLNSGVNQVDNDHKITLKQAIDRIDPLLEQCFEWQRMIDADTDKESFKQTYKLNTHALQLLRFLAQKGIDHG